MSDFDMEAWKAEVRKEQAQDREREEREKAEKRWIARLKKVINDMPDSLEISVSGWGTIEVHKRGAVHETMVKEGEAQNVPTVAIIDGFEDRVHARSETI